MVLICLSSAAEDLGLSVPRTLLPALHLSTNEHTYDRRQPAISSSGEQVMETDDMSTSGSDADSDPAGSLRDKLFVALQKSKFEKTDGRKFIPRSTFDEIFTGTGSTQRDRRNLVLRVMGRELSRPNEEDIELADYILGSAQKVFLIAVYIRLDRLHAAMRLFKDDKFTDERLPIDEWEGNKLECELESHPFVRMEEKGKHKSKSTKRIWRIQSISLFQDDQLLFLSPTISVHEQNCKFDNRRPIPFIDKDTHFSSGAHGVVRKYAIHHAHFRNSLNQVI